MQAATTATGSDSDGGSGSKFMSWPCSNATSFVRAPDSNSMMQSVKMIRTPIAYVAMHDTMPPKEQVIQTAPTPDTLRHAYQAIDRKMTGKREANSDVGTRPPKTPRSG